jgi:hypothetical protein
MESGAESSQGARIAALACVLACSLGRHWRLILGLGLAAAALAVAIPLSDTQGRGDLPSGYAVRMTCEPDPESALWSGGCDRVAADIARTDQPSFAELYRAFVTVHHSQIPSPAIRRRFGSVPCEPTFDRDATLKGTRFVFAPVRVLFNDACTKAHAQAIMDEIDARDRALLTIERGGLSMTALAAGTLANLSEPLVVFAGLTAVAALWML